MQLLTDPIVVLDTESTGFHLTAEVIELGAVCIDEWGRKRSAFSSLVKPLKLDHRARSAMQVNKIPPSALERAPSPKQVQVAFKKWLDAIPTRDGPAVCTAFNLSFDRRMLSYMGVNPRWGKCVRSLTNELMRNEGVQPKGADGKAKSPSLAEACRYLGVAYPKNAHRALADAEVTALVALRAFSKANKLLLLQ